MTLLWGKKTKEMPYTPEEGADLFRRIMFLAEIGAIEREKRDDWVKLLQAGSLLIPPFVRWAEERLEQAAVKQ